MGEARSLADVYRRFGEEDGAATSALSRHVALAISRSDEAVRAIGAAPARRRHPTLILTALRDLALGGHAPELAAALAAADGDAAGTAAIDTLRQRHDAVVDIVVRRQVRTIETGRCAALHPAVAAVAQRAGAPAVGLVDVGCAAGGNLIVDLVGISYDNGQARGDPASAVQLTPAVVGDQPIPMLPMPEVVARVGVDREPVDVTDADDARWLRAVVWPDEPERAERLEAEIALVTRAAPVLLRGDVLDVLPEALARVPGHALPVVSTTWVLSELSLETRLRFLRRLDEAATYRPVGWVSVEGVGVAPAMPTLGDRAASGHSIVGVAVFAHSTLRTEAVGRCWSRGRWLSWL